MRIFRQLIFLPTGFDPHPVFHPATAERIAAIPRLDRPIFTG